MATGHLRKNDGDATENTVREISVVAERSEDDSGSKSYVSYSIVSV